MSTEANDSAFHGDHEGEPFGLTKREYFAARAMQGILASPEAAEMHFSSVARNAVTQAEALIKALNGQKP